MGAPNDPAAHDKAAPSQEPPHQLPMAATGVPVIAPPPQINYVPWSTGLCDCCSDFRRCKFVDVTPGSAVCITFWCPCITFGQISEIVDRGTSSCGLNGAMYFLIAWVTGCVCCYTFLYRQKMRKQFSIEGSSTEDFVLHCFCESCALTQEYRELQNRGFDPSLGWLESVGRQNQGVAMAPIVEDGMKR